MKLVTEMVGEPDNRRKQVAAARGKMEAQEEGAAADGGRG